MVLLWIHKSQSNHNFVGLVLSHKSSMIMIVDILNIIKFCFKFAVNNVLRVLGAWLYHVHLAYL